MRPSRHLDFTRRPQRDVPPDTVALHVPMPRAGAGWRRFPRHSGGPHGQMRRLRQRLRAQLHRADCTRRRRVRFLRVRHPRPRPALRALQLRGDRPRRRARRRGVLLRALRKPHGAGRVSRRRIHSAPDLASAEQAIAAARAAGIEDDALSLVARSDIEVLAIDDDMKQANTDMLPAAARGAGYGAAAGVLAGLAAATFPPLGLTLAGAMLGGGAAGALVGTWASAMVGASIPEPERRHYEAEIEAGRVLVVVDADDAQHAMLASRFAGLGLVHLEVDGRQTAVG